MRIVGGKLKGRKFHPPKKLPVRPTTDFAKESLFNIIANHFDFESLKVLDLFAGTGNISFEFASRGCPYITSVDQSSACIKFIQKTVEQMPIDSITAIKSDVIAYLNNCPDQYDMIFADPPYQWKKMKLLPDLVFENELLKREAWFILEHGPDHSFEQHECFIHQRKYGTSIFSIFSQS